jgi:hypothetical protein
MVDNVELVRLVEGAGSLMAKMSSPFQKAKMDTVRRLTWLLSCGSVSLMKVVLWLYRNIKSHPVRSKSKYNTTQLTADEAQNLQLKQAAAACYALISTQYFSHARTSHASRKWRCHGSGEAFAGADIELTDYYVWISTHSQIQPLQALENMITVSSQSPMILPCLRSYIHSGK